MGRVLVIIGAKLHYSGKVFDEFVLELPKDPTVVRDALLEKG